MHDLHVTVSAFINDMVASAWSCTMCSFCMLRLVHDDFICTIACYGIGTIIFLIVTVNMEYHIIVLNYRFRPGFLDIESFCCIWFISFLLFIAVVFFAWVQFMVSLGLENVQFFNCPIAISIRLFDLDLEFNWDSDLQPGLGSSLGTHISVDMVKTGSFTTAKRVSNY